MNTYINELAEGIDEPCDLCVPEQPPPWLDKAKFERGRIFFKENTISVLISNFRNLVVGLSVANLCDVLILTQKSETKKKAFWRYIDTGYFMHRWLLGPPPWEDDQLYKIVNGYHGKAAQKFRDMTKKERREAAIETIAQLDDKEKMPIHEDIDETLMTSLREYQEKHQDSRPIYRIYDQYMKSDVIFSQFDMVMVHIAFFASVVVFPEKFGTGYCSDESFEDFLHMWRVIGYYLSVQDKFNPVQSTLSETRALLLEIGDEIIKPSFIYMNLQSLHMAKCVARAYSIDYHLLVYSHCLSHGIELDHLWNKFSLKQKFFYYWRRFFVEWIYCLPLVRKLINGIILRGFDRMHKKRAAASSLQS